EAHPGVELDVVTLFDADTAVGAVQAGRVDATFRAVGMPGRPLPESLASARVLDEPLHLLTGPEHALAGADSVTPAELAGHRIWMPSIVEGVEWAAYYASLAAEFGLTIDSAGPNFGSAAMLDRIAGSPELATFIGEHPRLAWPAGHDLRRIPVTGPTPVYPHSLIWDRANAHPALAALRAHLTGGSEARRASGTWVPDWAVA
ncbi:LysR family transcriptional regulator, partial [Streptomyces sp. SID1328]|uniref:substrate-binding domain-containing protein n=1 Tax=Streptomyces sp. SID1328 TaxID=2690250 RepID=UPI001394E603